MARTDQRLGTMMQATRITRRQFVASTVAGALGAEALSSVAKLVAEEIQPGASTNDTLFWSDLSQCQPASRLTRTFQKNRWQLVDYETLEGIKGTMVYAVPEDNCAELILPLNANGLHRVYLGINYARSPYFEWTPYGQLEVKLSDDAGFGRVAVEIGSLDAKGQPKTGEDQDFLKSIQEAYWRTADITGKSLVFRQPQPPYNDPSLANFANLCYVKLVPVSSVALAQEEAARTRPETRRLGLIYCTAAMTGHLDGSPTYHPTSESWFEDEMAAFVEGDFKVFICEALRGNLCTFRTQIGDVGTDDNHWPDEWVDPLAAFTRLSHANGLKIFASLRMIGYQYPTIKAPVARAQHYWRHPEWTRRERDGTPVSNWSLAFPGVRQHWLSLLREALAYGIDGIQIHLNRCTPFVMYEQPVVHAFKEKHGQDPRKLSPDNDLWLSHRAGYLTQFIREVRALVDEKPGRELAVTVYGPTEEGNHDLKYRIKSRECDVETWLREGLVDYVMPSSKVGLGVLREWRKLCGETAHLWPDLMPREQPAESYARLAGDYYEAGADGFCVWESERRHARISEWAAIRKLGHRELLQELIREGPLWYRRVPLKVLGGFSVQNSFRDG